MMAEDDDIPSPALQQRMQMDGPPVNQPSVKFGETPLPSNTMIELADGTVISEVEFGSPPPGLTFEEINVWYADREFELMCRGDGTEEE